jgi:holo-[acyl-carrier protein] synthase
MTLRIGVDILSVDRVRRATERRGNHFLRRAFTAREIRECSSSRLTSECFAGRFAAKESVFKALQSTFDLKPRWREIEVMNGGGAPKVILGGETADAASTNGVGNIRVSISHDKTLGVAIAVAIVVFEGR